MQITLCKYKCKTNTNPYPCSSCYIGRHHWNFIPLQYLCRNALRALQEWLLRSRSLTKIFHFLGRLLFFHFLVHNVFTFTIFLLPAMPSSTAGSLGSRARGTSTPPSPSSSRRTSPSRVGGWVAIFTFSLVWRVHRFLTQRDLLLRSLHTPIQVLV